MIALSLAPRGCGPIAYAGRVAGEPKHQPRDDTAPYELKLTDAPVGRAPEREGESVGSRLYRVAAPLLGRADAERVRQIANLLDSSAPAVTETVAQALDRFALSPSASITTMRAPSTAPRGSTIAITILAVTLGSFLIVAGVTAVTWASELRADVLERSRSQDAEIATIRLESARETATAKGRQDAQDKQQEDMQKRLDLHDKQIHDTNELVVTLTKHAVSRMDAIGKKTGADKLDAWTETPASLLIVTLRDRAESNQ